MKEKILSGNVPGVKDSNQAYEIIRKGKLKYIQAQNLAKSGTDFTTSIKPLYIPQYIANCIWLGLPFFNKASISGLFLLNCSATISFIAAEMSK